MSVQVSYEALANAASDINHTSKQVDQQLDDLRKDVQRLAQSWSGNAHEAYQQKQDQWDKAAADLNQVLAKIGAAVDQARDSYAQGESGVTKSFG